MVLRQYSARNQEPLGFLGIEMVRRTPEQGVVELRLIPSPSALADQIRYVPFGDILWGIL